MKALQSVLNMIINVQGQVITIKRSSDDTEHEIKAARSNYFRKPLVDEQIVSEGKQYVVSESDLAFIPRRTDSFILSATEYYQIDSVNELVALGNVIGYRLTLV